MSRQLINEYRADLDRLRQTSGSRRESVLREAFKDLLKAWGRQHDLTFIPEYALDTLTKDKRYVDGALLYDASDPKRRPVSDFELGQPGMGDTK